MTFFVCFEVTNKCILSLSEKLITSMLLQYPTLQQAHQRGQWHQLQMPADCDAAWFAAIQVRGGPPPLCNESSHGVQSGPHNPVGLTRPHVSMSSLLRTALWELPSVLPDVAPAPSPTSLHPPCTGPSRTFFRASWSGRGTAAAATLYDVLWLLF